MTQGRFGNIKEVDLRHHIPAGTSREYEWVVFWHSVRQTFMAVFRKKRHTDHLIDSSKPTRVCVGSQRLEFVHLSPFEQRLREHGVKLTGEMRLQLIADRDRARRIA
jgi:hypothetical protein